MEVKGTAVKSIVEFVKGKYSSEFVTWLNALPPASSKIINDVRTNSWYPLQDAAIIPSELVGKMFFNGDADKGAWELGRYSAEVALQGIYRIYVKFSSPNHIISRAQRIISAYYTLAELQIENNRSNSVQVVITKFDSPSNIIDSRFCGWFEKALEISGCKNIEVLILSSLAKGDKTTTIECRWS